MDGMGITLHSMGAVSRGGHRHRQVGRMPDTDLIPDIRSKGVKDHTSLKNGRQRSCPLPQSLSIVDYQDL
jgi:hypothetical protein